MLEVGTMAPAFTLKDAKGNDVSLNDFLGKNVILYFYPRDNTPGCTREAVAFKNLFTEFEKRNTVVIGISKDSVKSHEKFMCKHELPFILLSNEQLDVLEAYDVYKEKKLYGKVSMGTMRQSYLIDPTGKIVKVYKKVKPDEHASELIADLDELFA